MGILNKKNKALAFSNRCLWFLLTIQFFLRVSSIGLMNKAISSIQNRTELSQNSWVTLEQTGQKIWEWKCIELMRKSMSPSYPRLHINNSTKYFATIVSRMSIQTQKINMCHFKNVCSTWYTERKRILCCLALLQIWYIGLDFNLNEDTSSWTSYCQKTYGLIYTTKSLKWIYMIETKKN